MNRAWSTATSHPGLVTGAAGPLEDEWTGGGVVHPRGYGHSRTPAGEDAGLDVARSMTQCKTIR